MYELFSHRERSSCLSPGIVALTGAERSSLPPTRQIIDVYRKNCMVALGGKSDDEDDLRFGCFVQEKIIVRGKNVYGRKILRKNLKETCKMECFVVEGKLVEILIFRRMPQNTKKCSKMARMME